MRLENRLAAVLVGSIILILASVPAAALAGDWQPDPALSNPELHHRIYQIGRNYGDANFDPDANLVGTHTKRPPNKKQHATRESLYYAYGLLMTGDAADRERAQGILKRVVTFQDTKPDSPTYGIFNWVSEDPPSDMNSGAFNGLTLADIIDLDRRRPCLDADVRSQVDKAARLALTEVMHRDIDPGYTNIAMLSIAFGAAGEKLWAAPGAGAFAEAKLDALNALAGDGEFAEYLSPTYMAVSLNGAYMARKFAFSDAFAAKADATIDHMWKQVALAYHAPSYQLGGPFLRAYGDNMLDYAAGLKYYLYIALNGDYPLPDTEIEHDWDKGGLVAMADLPITVRPEFKQPVAAWRQWKAVGSGQTPVRELSQYRDDNFILGTVAFQDEWKQKRNLVAYWRNDGPPPQGFRVGFCIDQSNETVGGFAGEKLNFYCQQVKGAALVALVARASVPGQGTSTLVFDDGAAVGDAKTVPLCIKDGAVTTYLYPVTTGSAKFENQPDPAHHVTRVVRSWNNSDIVDSMHVLAYLVVFKPADQAPPEVSGLSLATEKEGVVARAKVDGAALSVSFKN